MVIFLSSNFCPKLPPRIFASAALISVDGLCFAVVAAVARLEWLVGDISALGGQGLGWDSRASNGLVATS